MQREVSSARLHLGADSAARFGYSRPTKQKKKLLEWQRPKSWVELEPTQFRLANFGVPGEVQCFLSILPGEAGGVLMNLNRWRQQLDVEPIAEQDLESLQRLPMLGSDAIVMDVVGKASGAARKLTGLVLVAEDSVVFVKMLGSPAAVDAERGHFEQFVHSVRRTGENPTLRWQAPEDWQVGAPHKMRVVTFLPPGEQRLECYVTMLRGSGGSALDNINRWREQIGLAPTDQASVTALPHIDMLSTKATLVELRSEQSSGTVTGLLGVICPIQGHCVFIKMVGPIEAVQTAKTKFLRLAKSIES